MSRLVAVCLACLLCGCASSKSRRGGGGGAAAEQKQLQAAQEENARLRAELATSLKDAETTFAAANAAQGRLGQTGCAAVTSSGPPGNGSQALKLQLRHGGGAALLGFSGAKTAGPVKVFPCSVQVRR